MAVTDDPPTTLVLRFADVGVATYAGLRVVGAPDQLVTWMLADSDLTSLIGELTAALPDPAPGEQVTDALARAFTRGAYATPDTERQFAGRLGALLPPAAWDLLRQAPTNAVLFVSPSTRLSRVPWALLAAPDGDERLIELVDVAMAIPANIANSPRPQPHPLLKDTVAAILDPKVPGQRPDSALGSVLGRPSADSALARHFADHEVLPVVADPVALFRRTDIDRQALAVMLDQRPARLIYVGHASAGEDRAGYADRAALHLAEPEPLSAADIITARLPIPPRVALLACSSGADYRFDEATGLVAAMILGGAQVVTATLWSLPTTAGYRRFIAAEDDPMSALVIAVDDAHGGSAAAAAVNRWQRDCLQRWRSGDVSVGPLYWAALVSFTVDGAR